MKLAAVAAALALAAGCSSLGCSSPGARAPEPATTPIPAGAEQLITAIVDDWTATRATLRSWRRAGAGAGWRPDGEPWSGVVGSAGTAWGAGLHGDGPPAGRSGPVKREGDARAPAGAFALDAAYGYAAAAPAGTRVAYTAVDPAWKCVDDPRSRRYNQILDQRRTEIDWASAEDMRRADDQYAWVVAIGHNPRRAAGAGSCIFFHVWRDDGAPTVGCTAMAEPRLAALLAGLAPSAVYVLLPRAEYAALADRWGLPREPSRPEPAQRSRLSRSKGRILTVRESPWESPHAGAAPACPVADLGGSVGP